jgi:tRNA (guanine-N7-)-methyltransferase
MLSEHQSLLAERRRELRCLLHPLVAGGRPIVWEVGCGHGHFLTAFAAAQAATVCVGIDIARDRIARANRKRERSGLPNLHFIRADAGEFLASLPEGAVLSAIYVLFPDPWPKRRHHKHRVLRGEFLDAAAARAGAGAHLYLRTDYEPYFREAVEAVADHAAWRSLGGASWPFEHPTVFQEKAERHWSLTAERR